MKGICDSGEVPDSSTNHSSVTEKEKRKSTCHVELGPLGNADQREAIMQAVQRAMHQRHNIMTALLPMGQAHKLVKTLVLDSHRSGSQSRSTNYSLVSKKFFF